jgi:hypothetical protein
MLEGVGDKRHAPAAVPTGSYERHVGKTMKQSVENLFWVCSRVLEILDLIGAYITADFSNVLHTKFKYNQ